MPPNTRVIELCLTYRCNVQCANCSNLCTQAPAGAEWDLPFDEIRRFVEESIALKWEWDKIVLHGGEPTLRTDIVEVAREVMRIREYRPSCELEICTNGTNSDICQQVQDLGWHAGIAPKHGAGLTPTGDPVRYIPVNESPLDLGLQHDRECFQSYRCGICLNRDGYWPCSPMAAAARVFGYESEIESVDELGAYAVGLFDDYLLRHCGHCGFSLPGRRLVTEQTSTETWSKLFANYNRRRQH